MLLWRPVTLRFFNKQALQDWRGTINPFQTVDPRHSDQAE